MTANGLSDKQYLQLIDILSQNINIESALLFGSRAMGTYKDNSDIDIALFGKQLMLTDLSKLLSAIEETTIPYKVDLLIKHKIKNQALIDHIDQYGVEVFRASI